MSAQQVDPRLFVAVAMSGEKEYPGTPACVWVNTDKGHAKYTPLHTITTPALRDGLSRMYKDVSSEFYIVVSQLAQNAHVFKFAKADAPRVMAGMADA